MRVVDPTLPRYGTDVMTLQNELLHTLCRGWDFASKKTLVKTPPAIVLHVSSDSTFLRVHFRFKQVVVEMSKKRKET
jgi:hypothetical protein